MENNLQELLKAENEVNRMVQDALNRKNAMLRGIKESSERDIKAFKDQKEREYQEELKKLKAKIEKRISKKKGIAAATGAVDKQKGKFYEQILQALITHFG
jgi:vacuolar-type H+-ATPase subunit H